MIDFDKIKSKRIEMKLTQEELAFKAGVTQAFISDLELWKYPNPSFKTIYNISLCLSANINDFLISSMEQKIQKAYY